MMNPPSTSTMHELRIAKRAAEIGGEIVARYFREGVTMRSKDACNLVSDADVESEQAIVAAIRQEFPDHAILAEESHHDAAREAQDLWIVDPLDGTNNFAHGIDHFAVSIAYRRAGQTQCGVIYNPIRGHWYEAVRGGAALFNQRPVRVADHQQITEALIGVGFYYDRGEKMEATLAAVGDLFRHQIHGIRRFGTAALDLVAVATGQYGGYFEFELSPWDFAAGELFVHCAGGRVTTCRGETLPVAKTHILASNGVLHDQIREIVETHLPKT